jgi:hypothetical protein
VVGTRLRGANPKWILKQWQPCSDGKEYEDLNFHFGNITFVRSDEILSSRFLHLFLFC